jgi:hypothetical protein
MKSLLSCILVLALVIPVSGQRIAIQRADRSAVRRVETTLNHLTVIELAEAAGSPSYKIERQGNKVLIQPIEENASTNLFIWTASGRFSYELVPATSIETTDFAIDQEAFKVDTNNSSARNDDSRTPVRMDEKIAEREQVVRITEVLREGEHLHIRYKADTSAPPAVFELTSPRSRASLNSLRYTQLSSKTADSIRDKGQHSIPLVNCEKGTSPVQTQCAPGLVTLKFESKGSDPAVLRLVFQAAGSKSMSVFLVL